MGGVELVAKVGSQEVVGVPLYLKTLSPKWAGPEVVTSLSGSALTNWNMPNV